MIGVIGICQTSIVYITEHAAILCKDAGLSWQLVGETTGAKKKRDLLFFPSYETFVHELFRQDKLKSVAVVFDSPEKLKRITPITFVEDVAEYSAEPLDIHTFFSTVQRLREENVVQDIKVKVMDPLKALVREQQKGKILHHYNRVVYSTSGARKEELTRTLLRYLFGDIPRARFLEDIKPFTTRGKVAEHFTTLWAFMESEEGQQLQRALREIKRRRFSPNINYPQLKDAYGADDFEMQFLAMGYCKVVRGVKSA